MVDNKQISIKDFKMWLQGVEEMQDENWTPSPSQWKRIREKIDSINDNVGNQQSKFTTNTPNIPNVPQPQFNNFPVPPSNIPLPSQHSSVPVNPLFGSPETGIPTKTPNVDTTDGKPYKSSFA